jgi:hypothetical protein
VAGELHNPKAILANSKNPYIVINDVLEQSSGLIFKKGGGEVVGVDQLPKCLYRRIHSDGTSPSGLNRVAYISMWRGTREGV